MNKDDKVVEICENTRLSNGGKISWYDATYQLNDLFETEKSWKAWRSIYRRKKGTHHIINAKNDKQEGKYVITEVIKEKPKKIEIEVGANGTQHSKILVNLLEYPLRTPKDILELHGYDLAQWELVNHKLKIWNTYSKQDGTSELYSSSLTVKPTGNALELNFISQTFEDTVRKFLVNNPEIESVKIKSTENGYMLELGIYDVHLGKFAWHEETDNDYDLKIAVQLYRECLQELLEQAKMYNITKIVIIFGHDFFHYDNMEKKTTGGTPQDTDTRLHKMFTVGLDLIFETIYKCLKITKDVDFMYVPSNHDFLLGFFASEAVRRSFAMLGLINFIDVKPKSRKYYRYHDVLLCLTHNSEEKKENLITVMQSEQPQLWAETSIREIHCGHLHHEYSQSYNGLLVRGIPSISATDRWHYNKGWSGTVRKGQAFVWHEGGSKIIIESIVKKEL